MQFASALSHEIQTAAAMAEVLDIIGARLSGPGAQLGFVFASPHHLKAFPQALQSLQERVAEAVVLGCTGGGVLGDGREIEQRPALALLMAHLPGVTIVPFHLEQEDLETEWERRLGLSTADDPSFVLLPDPFTINAQTLLERFNSTFPRRPVVGGLASGGRSPDSCALFLNGEVLHGAVGVGLMGRVTLQALVSQGCKPIDQPYIITRGEQQVIYELGGRPALEVVQEAVARLSPADQRLAETALLLGRVIDECQEHFGRGDFLIRTFMGADPASGAIAVGDTFRPGQTVQLHVRDAATAREDLRALTSALAPALTRNQARGALLFSCNGRGLHLYGEPDHDSRVLTAATGPLPMAGFFCNGEIGPIGQQNFLHGFTASIGIFQEQA